MIEKQKIIAILAYFDLFDYPLTDFEIWQFYPEKVDFLEIRLELEKMVNNQELILKQAYYCLPNRQNIIQIRKDRYNITDVKAKKVIKICRWFRLLPSIKLIALANSIGEHNLKPAGDLDLFIITKTKTIWATRFFCASLIKLLNLRPTKTTTKNKICLSFFIAETNLDLSRFMLVAGDKEDLYFIYWLTGLMILYDQAETYQKLVVANNWLKIKLPNWSGSALSHQRNCQPKINFKFLAKIFLSLIKLLEPSLKKFQLKILPTELKELMNQGTGVVVNDQVLKFHSKDRREEYYEKYLEKLKLLT